MRAYKMSFLRVLIAASWADGDVTAQELNKLRAYFRVFALSESEEQALAPYLLDPMTADEARAELEEFAQLSDAQERSAAMAAIRELILVDGSLDPRESEFLFLAEEICAKGAPPPSMVNRVKRLLSRGQPMPARAESGFRRCDLLDEFVRNRVLYQVKRRLAESHGPMAMQKASATDLVYLCALGALLGRVAHADGVFDDDEKNTLVEILERSGLIGREECLFLLEIIEAEILRGFDDARLADELVRVTQRNDRERIVRMLFEIAISDGKTTEDELGEISRITRALGLSDAVFESEKKKSTRH